VARGRRVRVRDAGEKNGERVERRWALGLDDPLAAGVGGWL